MKTAGHDVALDTASRPAGRFDHGIALIQAALTVLLFYLAFPGGPAPWLGWLVMVPLGIALTRLPPRQAFLLTFTCAFFGWLVATWWVVPGLSLASRSPVTVTLPFAMLFCIFYALPYAIAGWVSAGYGWLGTTTGAFKSALAWTAITYSVPQLLPGNLVHTQYTYPLIIQLVDIAGIPLLLFIMHWFSWLLVATWVQRQSEQRQWRYPLGLAIGLLGLVCCYGSWRLAEIDALANDSATTHIAIGMVQPNLPITGRERDDWLIAAPKLLTMTRQLVAQYPATDLLVWPEIPTPFSYTGNIEDRVRIDRLVNTIGLPLLLTDFLDTSPDNPATARSRHYFNTMELVSPEHESQIYRKQQLLPFGEYIPGEKNMPLLRSLFPAALHYVPGNESAVFQLMPGVSVIPLICYEALFPKLTRAAIQQGGNLIVNTVNDAWFMGSNGPQIHLALALFRTVEFRLPLVRATNSGISVVVDAGGRIVTQSQLPEGIAAAHTQQLFVPELTSVYTMIGNRFVWLLWGLLAVFLISDYRWMRRQALKSHIIPIR